MDFRIDAVLPATAARLWTIFFDVKRVAGLIPGCEQVVEEEPFKAFSAVMMQKIGPFRLEVPTRIVIESHEPERQVVLHASGTDRRTGTTIDVRMHVVLEESGEAGQAECRLGVDASMQVAGRLASLGYPIVKKRSEELFAEFERRLRAELSGLDAGIAAAAMPDAAAAVPLPAAPAQAATSLSAAGNGRSSRASTHQPAPVAGLSAPPRRTELVFQWPRLGINVAVAVAVAHGAVAFGQSPWWWLAAPLLGAAASLGKRGD
ncbi:SRPBCC domain-containing protein [Pigmentiphaga sp. CHJ604]|uniref:CoxG family protein n=1 Tax=Pigmentiphaga sp. CHJ604 TaxID=3081984 RepID=UPI0030D47BCB